MRDFSQNTIMIRLNMILWIVSAIFILIYRNEIKEYLPTKCQVAIIITAIIQILNANETIFLPRAGIYIDIGNAVSLILLIVTTQNKPSINNIIGIVSGIFAYLCIVKYDELYLCEINILPLIFITTLTTLLTRSNPKNIINISSMIILASNIGVSKIASSTLTQSIIANSNYMCVLILSIIVSSLISTVMTKVTKIFRYRNRCVYGNRV